MRVLIIDLNNFSHYPTLSVGYFSVIMRKSGITVDVLSPLSKGVSGYKRTIQARPAELYINILNFWAATTPIKFIRRLRQKLQRSKQPGGVVDKNVIMKYTDELLKKSPDAVLISSYTMYVDIVAEIAQRCSSANIPVLVGGAYFVDPKIATYWYSLPGVSAVYCGEPEQDLVDIVGHLVRGESISHYSGIFDHEQQRLVPTQPLTTLDAVPFPDYSDIPWDGYKDKIIPVMAGRGCGWGLCKFCSDVVISAGRTFRSRSVENVMRELIFQSGRFDSNLFIFLDSKIDSDIDFWNGMIEHFPLTISRAQWAVSVHVDNRSDNGLSLENLVKARKAGLVRITTGLESGSQKVLKLMAKGTRVKRLSKFLKDAKTAGISVRVTCIIGYPGEEPKDVDLTAQFLSEHSDCIKRIVLNRFALQPATVINKKLNNDPDKFPHISVRELDIQTAVTAHRNAVIETWP